MDAADQVAAGRTPIRRPADTARWLLPVLLPLVAVFVAQLVLEPAGRTEAVGSLADGALWGAALIAGLVLIVLVILAGTAVRRARQDGAVREQVEPGQVRATWTAVAVVAYLVLLSSLAGRIARLPVFEGMERHWQGKLIDLVWLAILFGILHRWARSEAGLRWRIEPGSGRPALLLVGGTFGLFVALTVLSVAMGWLPAALPSAEQLAYNATVPNLTEELIWRGAMLAVLAPALVPLLGGSRLVLGARVGWGVVITSLVFGLGHTILVDSTGVWSISVGGGLFAGVMGLLLGWLWCRTGSIWPVFLLHCAPEVGVDLGMILMA